MELVENIHEPAKNSISEASNCTICSNMRLSLQTALSFGHICAENCMNMEEIGRRGPRFWRPIPSPSPGSAYANGEEFDRKYKNILPVVKSTFHIVSHVTWPHQVRQLTYGEGILN